MPALDFFTSGSASAFGALDAGFSGVAALAAGAADALAAGLAAAVADCACAAIPAKANNAAIKVVFNMVSFPKHGELATLLQRPGSAAVDACLYFTAGLQRRVEAPHSL